MVDGERDDMEKSQVVVRVYVVESEVAPHPRMLFTSAPPRQRISGH